MTTLIQQHTQDMYRQVHTIRLLTGFNDKFNCVSDCFFCEITEYSLS